MRSFGRWREQRERGSGGTSLSWLLLSPVIFGVFFLVVAVGWRMYGDNLALDAANAGARAAAVLPVSADRGRQAAEHFLQTSASGTLRDTNVTVTLSGNSVVVVVTGGTVLLPGSVSRQASLVVTPG